MLMRSGSRDIPIILARSHDNRPKPNEQVVLAKCGQCRVTTLADLIGTADALVRVVAHQESMWQGQPSNARRRHNRVLWADNRSGLRSSAEISRLKVRCDRRGCRGEWPVLTARLEAAFLRAVAEGHSKLYLPDDL
jgi:hypothetical protein